MERAINFLTLKRKTFNKGIFSENSLKSQSNFRDDRNSESSNVCARTNVDVCQIAEA